MSGGELKLFDVKSQDILSYSDYFYVKPKPNQTRRLWATWQAEHM